jgi:thymidylate synthase (FAD)
VEYLGGYGDDMTVANAARVSFHKEASNYTKEQNEKLINYLAKHKHFSPFNHAFLSFRVKAPIYVGRQLVKHKFMPWNEVSRRYVDDEPEIYFREFHGKAANVKQGCDEEVKVELPYGNYLDTIKTQIANYNEAMDLGAAPEDARMLLPLNLMTEFIWSGTLGAVLDMLVLRLDPHTQYDSRLVAQAIAKHVQELFPVSYNARINS